jgi:hypothetical protein
MVQRARSTSTWSTGCDFGATQLALGVGRLARCHELLDRDLPISDQSVGLGGAGKAAAVADLTPLLQFLPGAPEIAAYRTLRLRRPGRPAAQRQIVDALRVRVIRVQLQPAAQLFEPRAIAGRMHVALVEHVAEQNGIVQLRDQPVGGFPLGALLQHEDLAIQCHIASPQMRQACHMAGTPGGRIELARCLRGLDLRRGKGEHGDEQPAGRGGEEAFSGHAGRLDRFCIKL